MFYQLLVAAQPLLATLLRGGRRSRCTRCGRRATKIDASENACREVKARLFLAYPSRVLLHPKHWAISHAELVAGMPGAAAQRQALPVHVRARARGSGAEAALLTEEEVRARVTDIFADCLRTHGGAVDPSRISHKTMGLSAGDERTYERLNRLLQPGQLRAFIGNAEVNGLHHLI